MIRKPREANSEVLPITLGTLEQMKHRQLRTSGLFVRQGSIRNAVLNGAQATFTFWWVREAKRGAWQNCLNTVLILIPSLTNY